MKKQQRHKSKKKRGSRSTKKRSTVSKANKALEGGSSEVKAPEKGPSEKTGLREPVVKPAPKKAPEKKKETEGLFVGYIRKAFQFLREANTEIRKVKWPQKKALLTSTAVVIILVLLVAVYLGLVDLGLIKILKVIAR